MQLNKSKRVFAIELISVVNVQKKKNLTIKPLPSTPIMNVQRDDRNQLHGEEKTSYS